MRCVPNRQTPRASKAARRCGFDEPTRVGRSRGLFGGGCLFSACAGLEILVLPREATIFRFRRHSFHLQLTTTVLLASSTITK